jgi:hypothetical protein
MAPFSCCARRSVQRDELSIQRDARVAATPSIARRISRNARRRELTVGPRCLPDRLARAPIRHHSLPGNMLGTHCSKCTARHSTNGRQHTFWLAHRRARKPGLVLLQHRGGHEPRVAVDLAGVSVLRPILSGAPLARPALLIFGGSHEGTKRIRSNPEEPPGSVEAKAPCLVRRRADGLCSAKTGRVSL